MKRLLTATTALALVGGASFAEITISGDAKLGLDYDSEPGANTSKHSFKHEMGVDFSGSGTTDGGLSFGGSAGFDTGAEKLNAGTVFVSGAFGTVTIGGNDAADLLAGGIADVGMNGVGVDDVAEDIRGTSAAQFRYDRSVGNIALAISAGTSDGAMGRARGWYDADGNVVASNEFGAEFSDGAFEAKKNSYAIGMSFGASGATFGIGYDSKKTISAGIGYSTGPISANALYAKGNRSYMHLGSDGVADGNAQAADGMLDAGMTGLGIDVSYTMGASTLTMVYAKTDVENIQPAWLLDDGSGNDGGELNTANVSFKGMGVGFSHDLGGGAMLVAGFAQVPQKAVGDLGMAELGQAFDADGGMDGDASDRPDLSGDKNMASVGLSFSF